MKIYLNNFKKFSKIIKTILDHYDQRYESFFFNFKEGYCTFQSEDVFSRIKLEFETEENEVEKNIFINGYKFLILVDSISTDYVIFKDGVFFDEEKTKYKFGNYQLEPSILDFDNYQENSNLNVLLENDNIFSSIIRAYDYILKEKKSSLNAVFISNQKIIATNKIKLYEHVCEEIPDNIDITIQENLLKFIFLSGDLLKKIKTKVVNDENRILLNIDDCLDIVVTENTNLSLPISDFDSFKKDYDHETYIKFSSIELKNVVDKLLKFSTSENNYAVHLNIKSNKLSFEIKDSEIQVDKKISIIDTNFTPLEDNFFILSLIDLKYFLAHIEIDTIQLENNSLIMNLKNSNDNTKHIVIIGMQ